MDLEKLRSDNARYLVEISHLNESNATLSSLVDRLIQKEIQYKSPPDDIDIHEVINHMTAEYIELFPEGHWASSIEIAQLFHRHYEDYRMTVRYSGISKSDMANE